MSDRYDFIDMTETGRDAVRTAFANQVAYCRHNDARVTARIVAALGSLLDAPASEFARRIADWPGAPLADALPLRAAGGIHALHLSGAADELAPIYADAEDINDAAIVAGAGDRHGAGRAWWRPAARWGGVRARVARHPPAAAQHRLRGAEGMRRRARRPVRPGAGAAAEGLYLARTSYPLCAHGGRNRRRDRGAAAADPRECRRFCRGRTRASAGRGHDARADAFNRLAICSRRPAGARYRRDGSRRRKSDRGTAAGVDRARSQSHRASSRTGGATLAGRRAPAKAGAGARARRVDRVAGVADIRRYRLTDNLPSWALRGSG